LVRYRSADEDSARWRDFEFRPGDIVISTRSKSGTTWMQMICALLVFGTPELPAPLAELSPWVDWLVVPREQMLSGLAAQTHRRFVKTHTPLDGVPIDPRATYIVVARHPLDMAVSLYHQSDNLNRDRLRALTGASAPSEPAARPTKARPSVHDWLIGWIEHEADPRAELDSLPGVLHHLTDAWGRRSEPNIVLVHYDDLLIDLDSQMRALAARLDLPVPDAVWPALVEAASFDQMRAHAGRLAPDPAGIMKSRDAFFRRGSSGAGRDVLTDAEFTHYLDRVATMAPADLLAWLHPS